jgi:hypothetical protein
MTTAALFPWESVDVYEREQVEAELWADMEHDAWLEALFADDQPASIPLSDPLFTEWWNAGAPSVAGQWTMLGSAKVLPDYQREDFVGE